MGEHGERVMTPKADRFPGRQQAADPVLGIDAKGECEGIADPCPRNGRRDIHSCDIGHQSSRDHLYGQGQESEKGPYGHACRKPLPIWVPKLCIKKPVSHASMEPCSTNVLGPRQMAQVFAEF
jgi:hypothetical protein